MGDLDGMIERAIAAGGRLHTPKENFGEMGGWLAWIVDTEGNLIGLQQPL
jgi:predicted enzyme related to lactoylglutathione lyase